MDNLGLMAPIPSRQRAAYDKAAARERGWGGLLTSVAEPLEWLPGPAGDVAQAAATIGREGAEPTAILKAISQALMPQVLGKFSGKMSITAPARKVGADVPDDAVAEAAVAAMRRHQGDWNPTYDFSRKFPGLHLSRAGKIEYEFPSERVKFSPQGEKAIDKLLEKKNPNALVLEPMRDLVEAPELFEKIPKLKDAGLKLQYGRGGLYHPHWEEKGSQAMTVRGAERGGFRGLRNVLEHETQHFADDAFEVSNFAGSPEFIRAKLSTLPEFKKLSEPEQAYYSNIIYAMSYPEVRARTAQARTGYDAAERQLIPPAFETVRNPWNPKDIYKPDETIFLGNPISRMPAEEKAAMLAAAQRHRPFSYEAAANTLGVSEELLRELQKLLRQPTPASSAP